MYYLSFDLPTSVNKMYKRGHTRGLRLSAAAQIWKQYAVIMAQHQWKEQPLTGKLAITYRFFGSRADWDNMCKILGDAMNEIVYIDDSQIIQAHVYMYREEKEDPRVDVEIQQLW
jgi:Holliday junction resolvase RusA-like endonuclease